MSHIRQQMVRDRVEDIAKKLEIPSDIAFLRLVHSVVTGQSIYDFDDADFVDGGQDKQIDVISIVHEDSEVHLYIFQMKNTSSFESNIVIQMKNGLDWIFLKPKEKIDGLSNTRMRDQIFEYRSAQKEVGPSNIYVSVIYATNGLTNEASQEFLQEVKEIQDTNDNNTFAEFTFKALGASEIVDMLNAQERHNRKIDNTIKIKYDINNPSLVRHRTEGLKGLVCTTTANEIARIVNADKDGYIFDLNLRRFLGDRGSVNPDIEKTCTDPNTSRQFWFLNNGITIICDRFEEILPDGIIQIKNMQIVNGCQTASTIAKAAEKNILQDDTHVLLRIYQTDDPSDKEIAARIVVTTNNQNKIGNRDLKANDPIQQDIEERFRSYGYYYERKPNQYTEYPQATSALVATNTLVAQSYLSMVLKKPSDARSRQYKVWGEYYNSIFHNRLAEPYILVWLIYQSVKSWISQYKNDEDILRRKIAKTGIFHVARIAAYLWRENDVWEDQKGKRVGILIEQIDALKSDPDQITPHFEQGFLILEKIIQNNPDYSEDLGVALKSVRLDEDINKYLHTM